jgi:hypothetical protein
MKLHLKLTPVLGRSTAPVASGPTADILFWLKEEICNMHLKERLTYTKER